MNDIQTFGDYEVHPSNIDGRFAVVHNGMVRCDGLSESEAAKFAAELGREEIIEAVTAAGLCCEAAVCDAVLDVAKQGGDWRAELDRAIAADAVESKAMGIDE